MRKKIEVAGKTLEASPKKPATVVRGERVVVKFGDFDFSGMFADAAYLFKSKVDAVEKDRAEARLRRAFTFSWPPQPWEADGLGPIGPKHTCEPPTTVTLPVCPKCLREPAVRVGGESTCPTCWRKDRPVGLFGSCKAGDAARAVVDKVDLSLFPMPLRLSVTCGLFDELVRLEMLVPDRDRPSEMLSLGFAWDLKDFPDPAADEAAFLQALREQVRWLVHHELDEAFAYEGRRPFDPHEQPYEAEGYQRKPATGPREKKAA